jgi:RNA polymerase sigma-70 factor (ECF subfamily)
MGTAYAVAHESEGGLVAKVRPRVVAVVASIVGHRSPDLDDVVQVALAAFVRALPAFRGECDPAGYASRIAARVAVNARRRARASPVVDAPAALDEAPEHAPWPFERTAAERRKGVVRELIRTLSREQAETVALRFILGFSLDEVAIVTGAPVNTVRSRLRLAKEALRRRIEADPCLAEELELTKGASE